MIIIAKKNSYFSIAAYRAWAQGIRRIEFWHE